MLFQVTERIAKVINVPGNDFRAVKIMNQHSDFLKYTTSVPCTLKNTEEDYEVQLKAAEKRVKTKMNCLFLIH